MKRSEVCPKCRCGKLFVIEPATAPDPRYSNASVPVAVASAVMVGGEGFFGGKLEMMAAEVDAYVCANCGLTELYVRDLAVLGRMAEEGKGNVRVAGG